MDPSDTILFRVALALVHILESRLWVPDARELKSILAGNNAAALSVWRRSQGLGNDSFRQSLVGVPALNGNDQKAEVEVESKEDQDQDQGEKEDVGNETSVSEEAKDDDETEEIEIKESPIPSPLKISTSEIKDESKPDSNTPTQTPSSASFSNAVEAPSHLVPRDNLFAQYGVTEDLLFRTLEEQESWWKDSTLDRLLNRELE